VLVRDEAGNPVQADVIAFEKQQPTPDDMRWAQSYGHHYDIALAACPTAAAKRYRSDADGVVRIAGGDNVQCFGISDVAISTSLTLAEATVITMRPHRQVALEAITAEGRPAANLPLAIIDDSTGRSVAGGVTNIIGRCTIYVPWTDNETSPALSIQPLLVTKTLTGIPIAGGYFDGKPRLQRVQLPPVGSVRIQLAATARTSDKPAHVSLSALTDAGLIANSRSQPAQTVAHGEMLVPYVALNQQLRVFVFAANNHTQSAQGPTRPGEEVTITVHGKPVTVTGRLLDKDGQPIANRDAFAVAAMQHSQHEWQLRTDQEGKFSSDVHVLHMRAGKVRVQIDFADRPSTSPLSSFINNTTTNSREPRVARIVDWPTHGTVDLGDLTMQLAPALLEGKVVDLDGQPVADLIVQAPTGWGTPSKYQAKTAADGSFAFYDAAPDAHEKKPSLSLRVSSEHWRTSQGANAAMGDTADLQVRPICSAKFHLESERLSPMLRAYLVGKDGRRHASYPRGGVCSFRGLAPGKYSLQLELAGALATRIDDLELVHRKANAPAGAAVAWLDDVLKTKLQIRTTAGEPLDATGATASAEQNTKFVPSYTTGELQLPYLAGQEILIQAPLHRSQRVKATSDAKTVIMQPRADLRISAPAGLALPPETWVRFDGSSEQQQLRPVGATRVRPDADGETYMSLIVADGRGGFDEVHSQAIKLPVHAKPTAIVLQLTAEIVAHANRLAAAGRAKRAARIRR